MGQGGRGRTRVVNMTGTMIFSNAAPAIVMLKLFWARAAKARILQFKTLLLSQKSNCPSKERNVNLGLRFHK